MPTAPPPDKVQPLRARKAGALHGTALVPGDKSISQRALILGALAVGETRISGLLESEDVLNTAGAVQALGAGRSRATAGGQLAGDRGGRGRTGGSAEGALDFGNSGTGSRLVMGAMATTPITAIFTGDASLRSRPMARVLDPLTRFGVRYEAQGAKALMPVTLTRRRRRARPSTIDVPGRLGPGEIGAAAGGAECARAAAASPRRR